MGEIAFAAGGGNVLAQATGGRNAVQAVRASASAGCDALQKRAREGDPVAQERLRQYNSRQAPRHSAETLPDNNKKEVDPWKR